MTSAAAPSRLLPPMLTFHKPGYAAAPAARSVTPPVPAAKPDNAAAQAASEPITETEKLFREAVVTLLEKNSTYEALIAKANSAVQSRSIEVYEIHQVDMGTRDEINAITEELGYRVCKDIPAEGNDRAAKTRYKAATRAVARNLALTVAEDLCQKLIKKDPQALATLTAQYRANKELRVKMWKQFNALKKLSSDQLNALKLLDKKQLSIFETDPVVQGVFNGMIRLKDTLCEDIRQQDIKTGFCYSLNHYLAT